MRYSFCVRPPFGGWSVFQHLLGRRTGRPRCAIKLSPADLLPVYRTTRGAVRPDFDGADIVLGVKHTRALVMTATMISGGKGAQLRSRNARV